MRSRFLTRMRKHNNHRIFKLLPEFRFGNEGTFVVVFNEFYPSLCYYALQVTGDRMAAQDIAEEAFIEAWNRRESIVNVKGFLYTKTKNDSLNWLRAEKTRLATLQGASIAIDEGENSTWNALLKTELIRELYSAINKLPPQRRKVFQMIYQEGLSVKETAAVLKLSVSAIKDHKKYGILFLKKLLPFIVFAISKVFMLLF